MFSIVSYYYYFRFQQNTLLLGFLFPKKTLLYLYLLYYGLPFQTEDLFVLVLFLLLIIIVINKVFRFQWKTFLFWSCFLLPLRSSVSKRKTLLLRSFLSNGISSWNCFGFFLYYKVPAFRKYLIGIASHP